MNIPNPLHLCVGVAEGDIKTEAEISVMKLLPKEGQGLLVGTRGWKKKESIGP